MTLENFESALDYCSKGKLRQNTEIASLEDIKDYAFITLRFKEPKKVFVDKMKTIGLEIPKPLKLTGEIFKHNAKHSTDNTIPPTSALLWISPDEYLLIVKAKEKHNAISILQPILKDYSAFLVDTSGTYSFFKLGGQRALDILQKSTTYNVDTLTSGKVVSTNFGQTGSIIFRLEKASYYLLVRFSFAAYIYELLESNAQEYL